jgi:antitoxin VapB
VAVIIKDREADRLIRQLAARTGESITEAVKKAVGERLEKTPLSPSEIAERKRRINALLAKADAMPITDNRSADEILGYNEFGHFD